MTPDFLRDAPDHCPIPYDMQTDNLTGDRMDMKQITYN
jgi:hypothetical protein